jgi:hypothetical protein
MSPTLNQPARNLLEAALIRENPVERLGNALWLYVRLLTASSFRGTVNRHIDRLATDLSVTPERIERWLARLTDSGLIEIQSPAPFLVIKLGMWSENAPSVTPFAPENRPENKASQQADSYSNSSLQDNKAIAAEDGGVGEGAESLLQEILVTLGETDPESFRKVLQHYTPSTIRQALERVRLTPVDRVRKNKTALFRYLLGKLTNDTHVPR